MSEAVSSAGARWAIEWPTPREPLIAVEPTDHEIDRAAAALADFYNDAHNRLMMAHQEEPFTADAVSSYYRELRERGGRPFLLERVVAGDVSLLGDGDLRNIEGRTAEVAIMIGGRQVQGRGFGTRYAIMLHAFAFRVLGLERLYISVIPANLASRRLFDRLGYERDDSPEARQLIDQETDLTMSVSRARFEGAVNVPLSEIRTYERDQPPAASPPHRA